MIPSTINVFVKHKEHCNQDSFPLRFGFSFDTDSTLELKRLGEASLSQQSNNRWKFIGSMVNPESKKNEEATFVIVKDNGTYKMVTAWRKDSKTEYYLSEVMKSLRKSGALTVKDLLAFHPRYKNGELSEHADLVLALSENKTAAEIERLQNESGKTVKKVTEELNKLQLENSELKKANITLQNLLDQERNKARETNDLVNVTDANVLVSVENNVLYRGSSCTKLTLGNNQHWYMKTATFDRDGSITQKAKSLIGKQVVTTSWDPIREPGKWSSQGYFRNIHPV